MFASQIAFAIARTPVLPPLAVRQHRVDRRCLFHYAEHGGTLYDYFLIRHRYADDWMPLAGATSELTVVGHAGTWWLVHHTR